MSPPSANSTAGLKRAPLDVYKKVTIIRKPGDTVVYEDSQGRVQCITDLGDAALAATPSLQPKIKLDIPVPTITLVESYTRDIPANYAIPRSYTRYVRPTAVELDAMVEYNVDTADEEFLETHARFGSKLNDNLDGKGGGCGATSTNRFGSGGGSVLASSAGGSSTTIKPDSVKSNDTTNSIATTNPSILSSSNQAPPKHPHTTISKKRPRRPTLPLDMLELMLDVLEKATGFETIITKSQAERLITQRIPEIVTLFGSGSNSNSSSTSASLSTAMTGTKRKNSGDIGGGGLGSSTNTTTISTTTTKNNNNPTITTTNSTTIKTEPLPPQQQHPKIEPHQRQRSRSNSNPHPPPKFNPHHVPLRTVLSDVYDYWLSRRTSLKKPLLRRFWPITSIDDTNPHLVFRPREKEKYKLRKKRQNDVDAYRKMHQLKADFERVRVLLELVKRRESVGRVMLELMGDWWEGRIYELVDTSGLKRVSDRLWGRREELDGIVGDVPKYFDTQGMDLRGSGGIVGGNGGGSGGGSKKKKRKRSSGGGTGRDSSRSPTLPTPATSITTNPYQQQQQQQQHHAISTTPTTNNNTTNPNTEIITTQPKPIIADQDHPPHYLHPLPSRETYTSSWDAAVPFVDSYVNSHPTPTFRFRHRPRVGRGGRVVIDRLPRPGNPDVSPVDVFCTGGSGPRGGASVGNEKEEGNTVPVAAQLLELLPKPLDRRKIQRRIEDIAAAALEEDEHEREMFAMSGGGGGYSGGGGKNIALSSTGVGGGGASGGVDEGNGGVEEVMVKLSDWLDTDEQHWGEERFAIGPV